MTKVHHLTRHYPHMSLAGNPQVLRIAPELPKIH
jgi:hypothetical protein